MFAQSLQQQSSPARVPLRRSRENVSSTETPRGAVVVKMSAMMNQKNENNTIDSTNSNVKTQMVTVIENEAQLSSLINKNRQSLKKISESWIALILHAPWAWPNFHPRIGLVKNVAHHRRHHRKHDETNEQQQHQQQQSPLESWQWIVEQSQIPICSVDVDAVPAANEILGLTTSKSVPLICLYNTRTKKLIQKPCGSYVDIASQTLFVPITNREELEEEVVEAGDGGNNNSESTLLAYVGAAWCPPCCRIMPHLPELMLPSNFGKSAKLVKIDFDAGKELVDSLCIEKIPTFCAFEMRKSGGGGGSGTIEFTANGVQVPFGTLQNSDVVRVAEAVRKWCDLADAKKNPQVLNDDLFTNDDF